MNDKDIQNFIFRSQLAESVEITGEMARGIGAYIESLKLRYGAVIAMLEKEIDEKWVLCDEKFPPKGHLVLLALTGTEEDRVRQGFFDGNRFKYGRFFTDKSRVSHWRYLPKNPNFKLSALCDSGDDSSAGEANAQDHLPPPAP